jgi:hypothetical protein
MPLLPIAAPKYCDFRERKGKSHFFRQWNELLEVIDRHLN